MENGHGRKRHRGRAPRLPELVGEDRGEEAARRARLAAVIEALWAGLQELGRLLRSLFARRQLVEDENEVSLGSPRQGHQRQRGRLAMLYGDKKKRSGAPGENLGTSSAPSSPPPTAPSPLLVVNGESVPEVQKKQYEEYCRIRAGVPVSSCLCHMCFFEMRRHDHMTVRKREMLIHCVEMHPGAHIPCNVGGCGVRVSTDRAYQLHMHFCHPHVPF